MNSQYILECLNHLDAFMYAFYVYAFSSVLIG